MEHIYIRGNKESDEIFVLFHGTGGNENNLLFLIGALNACAGVVTFLGNSGEGKNRRFFAPLSGGKVNREDLELRVASFLELWDSILSNELNQAENKKIIFTGYSNGANFILALLEKRPDIADFTILMHPSDLGWNFQNIPEKNRIAATAGARDLIAPASDVIRLKNKFSSAGYENFEVLLLDGGHEVNDEEVEKLKSHYMMWSETKK